MESSFPLAVSVSLVLNVILGVVFSSMYIFVYPGLFNTKKNPYQENLVSPSSSLCLSCEYLSPSDYALYSEVVNTTAGHRLCCHSEDGELADFFTLAEEHRKANELSAERLILLKNWMNIWSHRENAAHLHIHQGKPVHVDKDENRSLIRWQNNDSLGSSFISGVSLEGNNARIRISVPGQYYIYSVIKVLPGPRKESGNFHISLQQEMTRPDGVKHVNSLQNKKFKVGQRDSVEWVSIQGIFKLDRGNKISILVSNESRSLIENSSPLSKYFGIYKISD